MGKLIVAIAIIGAVAFAWHKGWIQEWTGTAVDKAADSVKSTQRGARQMRPADPPEQK